MNDFNVIVALIGGITLLLGLPSNWLQKSPFPPTLLALLIGIALGPEMFNVLNLEATGERATILEKVSRVVLAIGLMGVALRIPRAFPRRYWREMLVLLGVGMPLMWAATTAVIYLILDMPFLLSALIAAVVTATDPVAASPIVTGEVAEKNIPARIRHAISFESGANDGLSFLFVFLPFLLLTMPPSEAVSQWLVVTLLWKVGGAAVLGALLGLAAGYLLKGAERINAIESDWRLAYTVALALLAAGAGTLMHSDELLVVFAAGVMFTQVVSGEDRHNEEQGQEAVNRFFAIPIFVVFGSALPWAGWAELGWKAVMVTVAVLLLRRPPVILLLRPFLSGVCNRTDALFMGWFGPIAVAAIYYASVMEQRLPRPEIWSVVSLVIFSSLIAHGLSGAPLTRLYGKRAGSRDT